MSGSMVLRLRGLGFECVVFICLSLWLICWTLWLELFSILEVKTEARSSLTGINLRTPNFSLHNNNTPLMHRSHSSLMPGLIFSQHAR